MLSLQSFLREGRVVGPCWEELKPKGPQGRPRQEVASSEAASPATSRAIRCIRSAALPYGPLGSSSSQHRRTLELILQEGSAFFSSIKPKVRKDRPLQKELIADLSELTCKLQNHDFEFGTHALAIHVQKIIESLYSECRCIKTVADESECSVAYQVVE